MNWNLAGVTTAVIAVSIFGSSAALADKGCKSVSSKCAIEIGGRCDPVSGQWEYGRKGAGGNTLAFNECLSRAAAKPKK